MREQNFGEPMLTQTYIHFLLKASQMYKNYQKQFPAYEPFQPLQISDRHLKTFQKLFKKLFNTYPTFHPNYIGQMIKPPADVASLSYFYALLFNSNNHALDGGPETSYLEKEAIAELAKMVGYKNYLGHLTSGGTMANLEGLWIAKMSTKIPKFAICENAHYTHTRLSNVLDFNYELIPMTNEGKMDLNYLERILRTKKIGTVVATVGTTGFGALDEIDEIVKLKRIYDFRLHVDAAYGGFFKILSNNNSTLINKKVFDAIEKADSVVIDPHKHGLQPYGCGSILFRDSKVGKFYKHDSPYTYFTSNELHLGEVTLECSRPGASAAALWTTLKIYPLQGKNGLHKILELTRKAAIKFYELLSKSYVFKPLMEPELDIVTYFPVGKSTKEISNKSEKLFLNLMNNRENPIYLSKYRLNSNFLHQIFPEIKIDSKEVVILRSVLMKPEHYFTIESIFSALEDSFKNKVLRKK